MQDKKAIFKTLSAVDVTPYVKWSDAEDGLGSTVKLPYLPWQHAHLLMMEHYPQYEWNFRESPQGLEVFYFADTTAEVSVLVSIDDITTYASKAVTGIGNKAVKNPTADDIHNAKMRCRVRALAELGLGFDLWVNPNKYPYNPTLTDISNNESGVLPDNVGEDITYSEPDVEADKKNKIFQELAVTASTEKKAKALKPRAGRAWANRKWDMDEFHERWEAMCTDKGYKK